jgi:hypothetical protein
LRTSIVPIAMTDTAATEALRFRPATFQDHGQIKELESRYALETETYEQFVHLWANNPVYQEHPNWPIGWVLENEDDQVVGYIGNVPLLYEFGDQRLVVSSSRALVVDTRYRSYSLPLLSHFFKQKGVDLFLDTTVNAEAGKAHEIFRALRVPSGSWDQSVFWITDYQGFSASLLVRKEVRGARSLSFPVSAGLFLRDALAGRVLKTRRNGFEPSFCAKFDERFEDFWQKLRQSAPRRLLANRSREMLDWHFKYPLAKGRAWVLTICKGSTLAAYAIFFRQDNPLYALKRMCLVDFQALDGHNHLLHPLLCNALARCRDEGIHMLEAIGFPPEKQRVIDSLSPDRRSLSSWRYFYKATNRKLAESLKDPLAWDPSCFDGDASL